MVGFVDYDVECVCFVYCECFGLSCGVGSIYWDVVFEYCKFFFDLLYLY